MQYFNIQVASQLSGVASATIRAWEKRYNAVVPERADNKHRLYSDKDIEKLALLFSLTEIGQSIGKIAHLDLDRLKEIYASLMHKPYESLGISSDKTEVVDYEKMLTSFYIALSAYKLDILSHELEKAKSILSPKELCLNVLIPLFREIGNKVYRQELSIAQEHTLSAIVSSHVGQMIGQHYKKKILNEDLVLVSTPEGEFHQIGILAASLLLVHHGIKFIFLGPNLPAASLAEAANALKPKAILLGVTKGNQLTDKITFDDYLNEYSALLTINSEIWVGGNLKPLAKTELEKRKMTFFNSMEALDKFLQNHSF